MASYFVECNSYFLWNAFVQFVNMGNNADETVPFGKLIQNFQSFIQHIWAECTEAFVYEQRIQFFPPDMVLYHIGQSQSKRQRSIETFAARQQRGRTGLAYTISR